MLRHHVSSLPLARPARLSERRCDGRDFSPPPRSFRSVFGPVDPLGVYGRFAWRGERKDRRRALWHSKWSRERVVVVSSSETNPGASRERFPLIEGWEVLEKLGEGGMCAVFRARPEDGEGPERAIKMLMDLSSQAVERFMSEAELLRDIDHPNVVRVHHWQSGRCPWLVMDLLPGQDLLERMSRDGPMDPERAARLFADLANGLGVVHQMGVRHRDLKPANIMLGEDGVPRLIDFGIARHVRRAHVTQKGFVVGTASYLAPEVFTEDDMQSAQDGAAADVYALGQTLFEVLTGRPLHDALHTASDGATLVRIMRDKLERESLDPRDRLPHLPDGLAQVVMRATAREVAHRTPSADAFEADLRLWLERRVTSAEIAPVSVVPHRPPRAVAALARPVTLEPTPVMGPPPRRGWARMALQAIVGALGVVGVTAIAGGVVVVAAVGVGLLWAFRPPPSHVNDVLHVVQQHAAELGACPGAGGDGVVRVELTVMDGKATRVRVVESTMEARTERCVRKTLGAVDYPVRERAYIVEIPVAFH